MHIFAGYFKEYFYKPSLRNRADKNTTVQSTDGLTGGQTDRRSDTVTPTHISASKFECFCPRHQLL